MSRSGKEGERALCNGMKRRSNPVPIFFLDKNMFQFRPKRDGILQDSIIIGKNSILNR